MEGITMIRAIFLGLQYSILLYIIDMLYYIPISLPVYFLIVCHTLLTLLLTVTTVIVVIVETGKAYTNTKTITRKNFSKVNKKLFT